MTQPGPNPVVWIRFQTETGSKYEIARTAEGEMAWRRLSATLASGTLRSEGGRLLSWPEVLLGDRCLLVSEPINPPYPRRVETSNIVAFLDEADRVLPIHATAARRTFRYLQVGDRVTRVAAGLPMGEYVVSEVDGRLVHCGPDTFDRISGIEVDPALGWGPGGLVGTWLVHPDDEPDR